MPKTNGRSMKYRNTDNGIISTFVDVCYATNLKGAAAIRLLISVAWLSVGYVTKWLILNIYSKLQILISQTTDSHFVNYRFSFRNLQILISQTTDSHFANYRLSFRFVPFSLVSFRFAWFRFANYSKPPKINSGDKTCIKQWRRNRLVGP